MEPLFDVCYAGELLEGQDLQPVRLKVQKLFNANPDTLDKLFSGKPQILKRSCDKATAQKYQQAMMKAGAKALIRSAAAAKPEQPTTTQSPPSAAGIALAPAGSDVLRPEERAVPVVNDIDTASLDIEAVGTTLGKTQTQTPSAPDTSHLSVAEVGEMIPNLTSPEVAIQPQTEGISLTPEGTDFSDCRPPEPTAPPLDLARIELAPVGADVLEDQYKKTAEVAAPDTSHISLD